MNYKKLLLISVLFSLIFVGYSFASTIKTKSTPRERMANPEGVKTGEVVVKEKRNYDQCLNERVKALTSEMQNRKKLALEEYKKALKELKAFMITTSTATTSLKEAKRNIQKEYNKKIKEINTWFKNAVRQAKEECRQAIPTSTISTSTQATSTATISTSTTSFRSREGMQDLGTLGGAREQKSYTIVYDGKSYQPKTMKIEAGETVTFLNRSNKAMWPASDVHPTHEVYSGTSLSEHCPDVNQIAFDACTGIQPGGSWSFKFNKKGIWKYHDHLNPSATGEIIVE